MKSEKKKLVCYVTGAPASGKSTLCQMLKQTYPNVKIFSYSKELCEYVNAKSPGSSLNEDLIREKSSTIITRKDIVELDRKLIKFVSQYRNDHTIVIDSHPVTKEKFGFRVTAFGVNDLKKLNPDKIFCLYAPSSIIQDRIRQDPQGRPLPSSFELDLHCHAQISIATQYSVLLGKTCYLLDSSKETTEILRNFAILSGITGSS